MGRQKRGVSTHFFRPSGTFPFHDRKPSTEVLGYFLPPSGLGHGEHLRVPPITGSEAGQRAVHFVLRRQSASGDGAFARTGRAGIIEDGMRTGTLDAVHPEMEGERGCVRSASRNA